MFNDIRHDQIDSFVTFKAHRLFGHCPGFEHIFCLCHQALDSADVLVQVNTLCVSAGFNYLFSCDALEYGQQVEQSLDDKDNDSLNTVAERILDQQVAAAGVAPAIRITMPRHGRTLEFLRTLQIHPDTDMRITFKRVRLGHARWALSAAVALGILLFCRAAASVVQNEKKMPAV